MPSAFQLGADVRERIMASIRAGGYAHVAAQAWGVPDRQWRRWLRRGRRRSQREPYGSLYLDVQQAKAQARLTAAAPPRIPAVLTHRFTVAILFAVLAVVTTWIWRDSPMLSRATPLIAVACAFTSLAYGGFWAAMITFAPGLAAAVFFLMEPKGSFAVVDPVEQTRLVITIVLTTVVAGMIALILFLAANTAFNGFPVLGSILAQDRYLPRQLHTRGDRLAFSNGIITLALCAMVLIIGFRAEVTRLIQLYIVGVFVSFTLSQIGMVRHWNRLLSQNPEALARRRREGGPFGGPPRSL